MPIFAPQLAVLDSTAARVRIDLRANLSDPRFQPANSHFVVYYSLDGGLTWPADQIVRGAERLRMDAAGLAVVYDYEWTSGETRCYRATMVSNI